MGGCQGDLCQWVLASGRAIMWVISTLMMNPMETFVTGQAARVAGDTVPVLRVLAPNAGPMTGPGTNTYVIGSSRCAVIDPGPADPVHVRNILDAVPGTLEWILVTHTHNDHSPGARLLQRETGAVMVGLAAPKAEHNDMTFVPNRNYLDGEVLLLGEFRLQLIHTPGHVSNHFCYLLLEEGLLFTGDHVLEGTTSVILPPDGDMGHYLDSLRRLLEFPLRALAPGHGRVMHDPAVEISKLLRHRLQREAKIVAVLTRLGNADLDTLLPAVYDDVATHLLPWARRTLLAHLLKLERDGRAGRHADTWRMTPAPLQR